MEKRAGSNFPLLNEKNVKQNVDIVAETVVLIQLFKVLECKQ